MTPEERYLFDLQGFLVIENVLAPAEVAELNALLDAKDLWNRARDGQVPVFAHDENFLNDLAPDIYQWEDPFRRLLAHPLVLPYLTELVGPAFRFDHGYMILMRKGGGGRSWHLHGGGSPFDPSQFYVFRDGRMHNGLTVVSFALTDAPPGQGGFACVPGSHKANYPVPTSLTEFSESPPPFVQNVPWRAGSVVIFTEALTHGTWPWSADHERRSILYKFSPGHMSWAAGYPAASDQDFSATAANALRPPHVEARRATIQEDARS